MKNNVWEDLGKLWIWAAQGPQLLAGRPEGKTSEKGNSMKKLGSTC
jgi:hypothetical protein